LAAHLDDKVPIGLTLRPTARQDMLRFLALDATSPRSAAAAAWRLYVATDAYHRKPGTAAAGRAAVGDAWRRAGMLSSPTGSSSNRARSRRFAAGLASAVVVCAPVSALGRHPDRPGPVLSPEQCGFWHNYIYLKNTSSKQLYFGVAFAPLRGAGAACPSPPSGPPRYPALPGAWSIPLVHPVLPSPDGGLAQTLWHPPLRPPRAAAPLCSSFGSAGLGVCPLRLWSLWRLWRACRPASLRGTRVSPAGKYPSVQEPTIPTARQKRRLEPPQLVAENYPRPTPPSSVAARRYVKLLDATTKYPRTHNPHRQAKAKAGATPAGSRKLPTTHTAKLLCGVASRQAALRPSTVGRCRPPLAAPHPSLPGSWPVPPAHPVPPSPDVGLALICLSPPSRPCGPRLRRPPRHPPPASVNTALNKTATSTDDHVLNLAPSVVKNGSPPDALRVAHSAYLYSVGSADVPVTRGVAPPSSAC
jgi:hypothetical protein